VAVFTASNASYANNVINYIDPTGELIQHRFFRPHCILQDDVYVKDLRIFKNVHLKDILIVDNAVYSFGDQIDNGIPITPFKEDPRDTEFLNLIKYLERCADVYDVREINKKAFQLRRIFKYNLEPFIKYYDFEECERLL
jgi:CTD small phosphatase-like protein 2